MLSKHWDNHSGIFRPLAFVNGRRVGRHQHIELTESVCDGSAVEGHGELPRIGIEINDGADVAVVDLFLIVILNLHHLITRCKGPTESLDLAIAGGMERCLQLNVKRSRTNTTAIHRTQPLAVTDGIMENTIR